jgi:uncharacterized protein
MIGPYMLSIDGRRLYGGVSLKEHHVVRREEACFVLIVDDMAVSAIEPALADGISRLAFMPGTLVPERLMHALQAAGLVAEDQAGPPAAPEDPCGHEDAAAPGRTSTGAVSNLALFLTQSCNLTCSYCYGDSGTYGGGGLMSGETARAAVDWLLASSADVGTLRIGFFGGEPLLNLPLLKEVVRYARERTAACGKEVSFGITTNATLIDDDVAAYLAAERIQPLISCDGPPDIHDRQRPFEDGRGSHAEVVAAVQRLRPAFPDLVGRATVCGHTDPVAVHRGLEKAGFTRHSLILASPVLLHGDGCSLEEVAREEQVARMLAYRRAEFAELFAAITRRAFDPTKPPAEVLELDKLAVGRKRYYGCGVGRGLRAVSVDGGIYPCHRFVGLEEFHMGHVGGRPAEGLNDYHRAIVRNLPACRACWARYFCGGGCFYDNLGRTGEMHRADPLFCEQTRALFEDVVAGWCRLSDEDRAYVRDMIAQAGPDSCAEALP